MKRKPKIVLLVMILLLLILVAELLFRPRTLRSSLAQMLYHQERYESAAKIFERYKEDEESAANLAKTRYKQGEYQQATDASEDALKSSADAADLHYDRGNIAFKEEDYQTAVEQYEQALLPDSTDDDARANLELALKRLIENPPPPPKPEPNEDKRDEEEVRNMLEALDNLEARERKNQRKQGIPKTDNWW